MNLETLIKGHEPTEGARLLAELCEICPPNAGSFIWQFGKKTELVSDDTAKNVASIFALHGDELAPLKALKILMSEIIEVQNELRGQVTIIIGNPLAVMLGTRGIGDGDANRLFGKSGNTLNHLRVAEIEDTLLKAWPVVVNDYHCTRNPSKPFVFVPKGFGNHQDPITQKLVEVHGLEAVVLADYGTYTDSANEVDHWAIEVSKGAMRAITVEAGCLQDECEDPEDLNGPIGITINGVKNVLKTLGIFDLGNKRRFVEWEAAEKWDIFDGVYAGEGFEWSSLVSNFGKFQTGDVYAFQNGNPLFASEDFSTMFVKNNGDFDPDNEKQRVALKMRRLM